MKLLLSGLAALSLTLATPVFAHEGHDHYAPAAATITLGDLQLSEPFTRATLPNAPVGAGYVTILNTGETDDRLVSATSPAARDVQIHEMKMEGDVMKMAELADGLLIPAGSTVALMPGGYHLMFMGLTQSFVEGTTIPVTLVFEKAGTIEIALAVGAPDAATAHGHDMHADHGGGMAMDTAGLSDEDAIARMQTAMFDTAGNPLAMGPIIVSGDYAISDWAQNDMAGRALLRKTGKGWAIHLCAGAGLKDAASLVTIGVPADVADDLARRLAAAEASLDPALVARYDSFEGTMMVDEGLI